jgi:hypothetical protein
MSSSGSTSASSSSSASPSVDSKTASPVVATHPLRALHLERLARSHGAEVKLPIATTQAVYTQIDVAAVTAAETELKVPIPDLHKFKGASARAVYSHMRYGFSSESSSSMMMGAQQTEWPFPWDCHDFNRIMIMLDACPPSWKMRMLELQSKNAVWKEIAGHFAWKELQLFFKRVKAAWSLQTLATKMYEDAKEQMRKNAVDAGHIEEGEPFDEEPAGQLALLEKANAGVDVAEVDFDRRIGQMIQLGREDFLKAHPHYGQFRIFDAKKFTVEQRKKDQKLNGGLGGILAISFGGPPRAGGINFGFGPDNG